MVMTPEWDFDKAFELIPQIKRTDSNATIIFLFKITPFR